VSRSDAPGERVDAEIGSDVRMPKAGKDAGAPTLRRGKPDGSIELRQELAV
jgi:hypothetical protein